MELKELVIKWNNQNRLDFIYRKKNKIRFNSKEHREITPIAMCFELLEDQLFRESLRSGDAEAEKQKEIDDELFDKIELD